LLGQPRRSNLIGRHRFDSFDQWGVELGIVLPLPIISKLAKGLEPALNYDRSTNAPIRRYRRLRGGA